MGNETYKTDARFAAQLTKAIADRDAAQDAYYTTHSALDDAEKAFDKANAKLGTANEVLAQLVKIYISMAK